MTQTTLITGAASGLGLDAANRFQARGWNVAAIMHDPSAGSDLAAFDNVPVIRPDVTGSTLIHPAAESAQAPFGTIDVLLNTAS